MKRGKVDLRKRRDRSDQYKWDGGRKERDEKKSRKKIKTRGVNK